MSARVPHPRCRDDCPPPPSGSRPPTVSAERPRTRHPGRATWDPYHGADASAFLPVVVQRCFPGVGVRLLILVVAVITDARPTAGARSFSGLVAAVIVVAIAVLTPGATLPANAVPPGSSRPSLATLPAFSATPPAVVLAVAPPFRVLVIITTIALAGGPSLRTRCGARPRFPTTRGRHDALSAFFFTFLFSGPSIVYVCAHACAPEPLFSVFCFAPKRPSIFFLCVECFSWAHFPFIASSFPRA